MSKWAAAGVLTLLVLAPALGQGGTEPAGTSALDESINGLAVATQSGAFVAVTDDVSATSGNEAASVWFYWGDDGRNIRQDGRADPDGCGPLSADCFTDATHVAVDATGDRMVVAGPIDSQSSILLFIETAAGSVHEEILEGVVTGLAMSDSGIGIAASTTRSLNDDGRVYRFAWATAVTSWKDETSAPAIAVSMSPDGSSMAAAVGESHHRYKSTLASKVVDTKFPGQVQAVAVSGNPAHLSIAGSDSGHFALYSDSSGTDNRVLQVRDSSVAISPISSVAIATDGDYVAVGSDAGTVWVYSLDTELQILKNGGWPIAQWNAGAAIEQLTFSTDDELLAVAAGNNVSLHHVSARAAQPVWAATLDASIGQLGINHNASRLVAASSTGSSHQIIRYEANHQLALSSIAARTIAPGTAAQLAVALDNTGNRHEQVEWLLTAPAGITATGPVGQLLLPSDEQAAEIAVSVPEFYAPGTYQIDVNAASRDATASQKRGHHHPRSA